MEMYIQVECRSKPLDQRDSTRAGCFIRQPCLLDQVCGDGAVDDAQHLTHNRRTAGKQKAQLKREAEYPLAYRFPRQDLVYQQDGAFRHTPCPAAGAEAPSFAAERHEAFSMAGVTTHPQEAMFQTAAFQVVLEFPPNIPWQFRPMCGQLGHERRIVLIYQLVEQRLLWAMAFVTMTTLVTHWKLFQVALRIEVIELLFNRFITGRDFRLICVIKLYRLT